MAINCFLRVLIIAFPFSMMLSQIPLPKLPISSNSNSSAMMMHLNVATSKLRIAYQGIPGAYGEAAAIKAYPNCVTLECKTFKDAMEAVERGLAAEAVIPIENSIGGSVYINYELLQRHRNLHVVGETHVFIDHCLLALPTVSIHQLNSVSSHPQALAQCQYSLKMLGVATRPTENTAVAAQSVASEGIKENGAIASARAAELYGLNILVHKFQDRSNNITRFLKLASKPLIPTTNAHSKTSILFTPYEGRRGLYKALSVFAATGIHLSKIESRPLEKNSTRKNGSDMYFTDVYFIDFEASVLESRVEYALERLKELASDVRILGCYPMDADSWNLNLV